MATLSVSSMHVLKSSISHNNSIYIHRPTPTKITQMNKPHLQLQLQQPSSSLQFHTSRRRERRRSLKTVALAFPYSDLVPELCKDGLYDLAVEFLAEIIRRGRKPNKLALTALIHGLCKEGHFTMATDFVHVTCQPDVATYNCLIDALGEVGEVGLASDTIGLIWERGLTPDSSSYTGLIQRLHEKGLVDKAMGLMEEMKEKGIQPSGDATSTSSISPRQDEDGVQGA